MRDLRAADDARSVALGLQLLEEISGDGAATLTNQTRAALAMGLIVKVPPPAAPAPPVAVDIDDSNRDQPRPARTHAPSVTFDQTAGLAAPSKADR
jgi:hypothetical protein